MELGNLDELVTSTRLPLLSVVISLSAACLFGGLLGLEREWRDKPAGLRTHILISLAAATFALLTRDFILQAPESERNLFDIVRAVAGGASVLAAGTIISSGGTVRGLTTGSSMWLAASVGLASGVAAYFLAAVVAALGFCILRIFGALERLSSGGSEEA